MTEQPKVHIGLMIAALLLSILLWAVVYPQHLPSEKTRALTAKVTTVGLPENLVVTDEPKSMTVFATGTAAQLETIDPDRLEFVVSLVEAKEGRRRYAATVTPPAYQQFFPTEEGATFTIEAVQTKTLSVIVEPQGQLPDDALAVDDFVIDPQTVVVSGPESQIKKLASARVRYDLSKFEFGGENAKYLAVEPVQTDGSVSEALSCEPRLVKILPIVLSAPVSKTITIAEQVTGTIAAGNVIAGIEISPNTITIRGSSRLVNSINQIATEPVNVQDLAETKEFVTRLKVPKGITLTGGLKTVKVKVLVNKLPPSDSTPP